MELVLYPSELIHNDAIYIVFKQDNDKLANLADWLGWSLNTL